MPMPTCPGPNATRAEAEQYLADVKTYLAGTTLTPKCQIIQEACDCLKCNGERPFPDLCQELCQLGEEHGCTSLDCGCSDD